MTASSSAIKTKMCAARLTTLVSLMHAKKPKFLGLSKVEMLATTSREPLRESIWFKL